VATSAPGASSTILLVEPEILVRASLARYLRECGYTVVEALSADEAVQVLQNFLHLVEVVLTDAKNGFVLSHWVKKNRPLVNVIMTGTVERAANAAAELCDDGPQEARPHDPQVLVDEIKRALAGRDRDR
jgi:DNA-binding NtrC family response regulator